MTFDHEAFINEVYDIVRQIPSGRVLSYGRVAELAGWPNYARAVGRAMKEAPLTLNLPCHRVVNSQGRTVPGWHQQTILLMSEGVSIKDNGCVDMKKAEWQMDNY
ncbi:MAG: methylated-DNA--[protein]-cysteine S-methyltransferase [Bacteroidales bacterium]|nr:methylated-DNA--[protein]-cysteine S-methyltransferase [Bacteroidales bacterium]